MLCKVLLWTLKPSSGFLLLGLGRLKTTVDPDHFNDEYNA